MHNEGREDEGEASSVAEEPEMRPRVQDVRHHDEQRKQLPGIHSSWSESRREHLDALAQNARMEYAELAFRHGRFKEAAALTSTVLAEDPLRESAWQLKMRLASALGDDDAVLIAFRRVRSELAKLDLDVSSETRRLVRQLRS